MKKILLSLIGLFITATMLSANPALAFQNGKHKGNKLDVSITYQNFSGYMDYSSLGLGSLPIYYLGGTMYYNITIDNLKNAQYRHLVVLVIHRQYPSGDLLPGYQIDSFSGLPYHNIIYIDTLNSGDSLDLSFPIPTNAPTGADYTDVVIYRGYDLTDQSSDAIWSSGRIFFENTLGYFCPPEI